MFLYSIAGLDLTTVILIALGVIVVLIFITMLVNSGKYASRYKRFYRKMDRNINKKFNGNLLNEEIINNYAKDQTNTFKSLKARGKRKVKKYFEFYAKQVPEQVLVKSFTTSDKTKNEIVILLLDDNDKVLYRWYKKRKVSGIIKAANKYQMLNAFVGFFYELPINIHEAAPYRFVNHDNDYVLTYKLVKNPKRGSRKEKERKLTRKEIKAQEKVQKAKDKKARKRR